MAKLSKEKVAEYREQWKHEKRRINRYVRELHKRGYGFDKDLTISERVPDYVTKEEVEKLKARTWKKILKSTYYETDEGKKIKGPVAHKQIAKEKRAKTIKELFEQPIEDEELLLDKLYIMLDEYDATAVFKNYKIAGICQSANDSMKFFAISEEAIQGHDNFVRRVAMNYGELVKCVDCVQNYIKVHENSQRFKDLISDRDATVLERMEDVENYDDSDALTEDEISDYNIIDIMPDE